MASIVAQERIIKPLFSKGPSLGVRLLVLAVLSVSLMVVDARFDYLEPVRSKLGMVLTPSTAWRKCRCAPGKACATSSAAVAS